MADVAAVVCDTVLPNFKRSLICCGWMPQQGQLVQANRSQLCPQLSSVKPRTPQKLTCADAGSTWPLTENPSCLP